MVWARYAISAVSGASPRCDAPLFEMADMWGPVYVCDDCGNEMDGLDTDGEPSPWQRQLALPSELGLIAAPGPTRRSTAWQGSHAAAGFALGSLARGAGGGR